MNKLKNDCNPVNQTETKEKDDALTYAKKWFFMMEEIINAFKNGIFLYIDRFQVKKKEQMKKRMNKRMKNLCLRMKK